jgi:hypothetical protein
VDSLEMASVKALNSISHSGKRQFEAKSESPDGNQQVSIQKTALAKAP